MIRRSICEKVKHIVPDSEEIILSPTMKFFQWRVAIVAKNKFYVARAYKNHIVLLDEFNRIPLPDNPVMNKAIKDHNVSAFYRSHQSIVGKSKKEKIISKYGLLIYVIEVRIIILSLPL